MTKTGGLLQSQSYALTNRVGVVRNISIEGVKKQSQVEGPTALYFGLGADEAGQRLVSPEPAEPRDHPLRLQWSLGTHRWIWIVKTTYWEEKSRLTLIAYIYIFIYTGREREINLCLYLSIYI